LSSPSSFLEGDPCGVIADSAKRYFDCVKGHLQTAPATFAWDADEARVGTPKKQQAPSLLHLLALVQK
jgi:hypothetical protein